VEGWPTGGEAGRRRGHFLNWQGYVGWEIFQNFLCVFILDFIFLLKGSVATTACMNLSMTGPAMMEHSVPLNGHLEGRRAWKLRSVKCGRNRRRMLEEKKRVETGRPRDRNSHPFRKKKTPLSN
jgi:hypothetical protein